MVIISRNSWPLGVTVRTRQVQLQASISQHLLPSGADQRVGPKPSPGALSGRLGKCDAVGAVAFTLPNAEMAMANAAARSAGSGLPNQTEAKRGRQTAAQKGGGSAAHTPESRSGAGAK